METPETYQQVMDDVEALMNIGHGILVLCHKCDNSPYVRLNSGRKDGLPGWVLAYPTTELGVAAAMAVVVHRKPTVLVVDRERELTVYEDLVQRRP